MKVVISGGSGLIGQTLARSLGSRADVGILTRNPATVAIGRPILWDSTTQGDWVTEAADADVVVNLAGAGIADKRWSDRRKKEMWESRVRSTRAIVDALGNRSRPRRPLLLSASAIGYYGSRGDETVDEQSAPGDDYLAKLSVAWEAEARRVGETARLVIIRIGVVLAREGGALSAMLPIFKLGMGGPLGSGRQWMSWIHIDDLVRLMEAAIDDEGWEGVFNGVAPEPVRNAEFGRALGRALKRPAFLPAPGFALRVMLGEMAKPLLLTGQRVVPTAAMEHGFMFDHPDISAAFDDLVGS